MSMRGFVPGLLALLGAACGGSGIVSVSLTNDAQALASDLDGVTAINIAVKDIQLHVVDKSVNKDGDPDDASVDADNKWIALGVQESLDLVALDSVEQVFGETAVPEGKITQIRLLIDTAGTNNVMMGSTTCTLDVSAVAQIGVKISHPFKAIDVEAGKKSEVLVNFVAVDSVKKTGDCAFRLTPVIKLKRAKVDGTEVPLH